MQESGRLSEQPTKWEKGKLMKERSESRQEKPRRQTDGEEKIMRWGTEKVASKNLFYSDLSEGLTYILPMAENLNKQTYIYI